MLAVNSGGDTLVSLFALSGVVAVLRTVHLGMDLTNVAGVCGLQQLAVDAMDSFASDSTREPGVEVTGKTETGVAAVRWVLVAATLLVVKEIPLADTALGCG